MKKATFLLVLLLCPSSAALADDIPARLVEYMDAAVKAERFNGAVLVAKGSDVLLAKGYGLANAEHNVPVTKDTKFRLGSITKQFTATAIMILKDRGKLKVEDPIATHLADAPEAWKDATIHHLLTHTSGIPSYTDNPTYRRLMANAETVESMIGRFKDLPLEFEPGSRFRYSNSGYFLLGAIIEKVSGKSYESFVKDEIFEPLEMNDSGYDRPAAVLPGRAAGYERAGDGIVNAPYLDMNQPYSAGSLYSTVGDLWKWDRALRAGKLLSPESQSAMFQPFKNNYAYGWTVVEPPNGRKQIGHGGGINGFATDFERYPQEEVCVAVLCNIVPANPTRVARDLAAIVFGDKVALPKARVVAEVDPQVYDDYVGTYQLAPMIVLTVKRDGNRLFAQLTGQGQIEIFPESPTKFFLKVVDAQLSFVKEDDKVTAAILHQNGRDTKAMRVEEKK